MSSSSNGLSLYDETKMPNILGWKFGIVVSEWNSGIMENLLVGCKDTLIRHGANINDIVTYQVPGSFELTLGAQWCAQQDQIDAVICLGCGFFVDHV